MIFSVEISKHKINEEALFTIYIYSSFLPFSKQEYIVMILWSQDMVWGFHLGENQTGEVTVAAVKELRGFIIE